jgi:CelD/BcsL family acetyltransferase involved in cellulose biosynthesis
VGHSLDPKRRVDDWHIEVFDRIEPLEPHWRDLESRGGSTVFQSYDWLAVWYDVVRRHKAAEPVIVTARRAAGTAPEFILPLCRLRRRGYDVLTFADINVSDYAGPLFVPEVFCRPGIMPELLQAIVRALPRADAIHLTKLSATVGNWRNPLLDLAGVVLFPFRVWGMALESGSVKAPSAIPQTMLASTNKRRAALARKFTRTFVWHEDHAAILDLFDELVDMRTRRCRQIGREEILDQPIWRDFYATLIARQLDNVRTVITCLQVDGKTIAMMLGLVYGDVFYYLLPTFVMKKWSRYTPGFQLILDTMEASSARGCSSFDFLIGDESYKENFGGTPQPLYEVLIPLTSMGWLQYMVWRLKIRLRQYPRTLSMLKKLLRRQ